MCSVNEGKGAGGSSKEGCEPQRDQAVEMADAGEPARGGAPPPGRVQTCVDKLTKKCFVYCQRLDVLYQMLKQYLLS